MKTAFIFPGQGSQHVGMGKDLAKTHEIALDTFRRADEVLGKPITKWCFEGPPEELNRTRVTQPAVLTTSIAALRVLQSQEVEAPDFVAGHSLGEYSALVAGGSLSFEDALQLVDARAEYMDEAGMKRPGSMAAIINLSIEKVEEICSQAGVFIANYNTPKQTVISGGRVAISAVVERVNLNKSLRGIAKKLPVSIAAHSPLMEEAAEKMRSRISSVTFKELKIPFISNGTGEFLQDVAELKNRLPGQLITSVLWWKSVTLLVESGVKEIREVGPGRVLTNMIRKDITDSTVSLSSVDA